MNRPPKYPSTPHWPWSEKVHRDDSYHINPEFFVGKEIVITEKLDGGNTCPWNGQVYARSTTAPAVAGWFAMVKKHHAWKTSQVRKLFFYGEDLYGVHSIEYDPIKEDNTYHLFAVRHTSGKFLSWDALVALAASYKLPVAPVSFRGTFDSVDDVTDWFKENRPVPSSLGPEREGFVMRVVESFPADQFSTNVCKYVRANHVQTDEHWTRNWKPCRIKR